MHKIFIIHGWTYTLNKWEFIIQKMQAAGFEPVMLHVPGLTEDLDKAWTLDDYVGWLGEKLANENQPIVIGHSNGGRIALAFAAKYPEKLKLLILIDSAGIYHKGLLIRLKRAVFGAAAKVGQKITTSRFLRGVLYKLAGEKDYKTAPPHMRQTMVNLISADLARELEKISAPTLIIWGARDVATPLADGLIMNKAIKGSELFVIEEAAHSPHFTHAEKVCQKILQTIKLHDF